VYCGDTHSQSGETTHVCIGIWYAQDKHSIPLLSSSVTIYSSGPWEQIP